MDVKYVYSDVRMPETIGKHITILDDALSVLVNLEHRDGVRLERNTGNGAGILFQVPHRFFRKEARKCGHLLPAEGDCGVAMVFLPRDEHGVVDARRIFEEECAACGIPLLFWRTVPVDPHDLGSTAQACMPTIMQAFLGRPDSIEAGDPRGACGRPREQRSIRTRPRRRRDRRRRHRQ